jgi:uncharacterized protein (TIGR02246 family)
MSTDESEISRIVAAQEDGWNRGDAEAFGEACRENVGFTNILGMRFDTRAGFIERHAEMFRGPFAGSRLTIEVEGILFTSPETAVAELLMVLRDAPKLPPGIQAAPDGALHTRMLEVFARDDRGWRIAACHNTAVSMWPKR